MDRYVKYCYKYNRRTSMPEALSLCYRFQNKYNIIIAKKQLGLLPVSNQEPIANCKLRDMRNKPSLSSINKELNRLLNVVYEKTNELTRTRPASPPAKKQTENDTIHQGREQ